MRAKAKAWLGIGFVGALAVGFAGGAVLGAFAMVRQEQQWLVQRWIVDTTLLVRNARVTTLNPPVMVVDLIGSSLDTESLTLARLYDRLTPYQRSSLAFYANAAQSIAAAQGGAEWLPDRKSLVAFAACLKVAHNDRRTFDQCAAERGLLYARRVLPTKAAGNER